MADSTVTDVTKMKVVHLRKELKPLGLTYTGDKAELVTRLQAAMSQDDHGDINLDSDEIDSDGVLEDEDDKSHADILDDAAVDTLNEELALAEHSSPVKPTIESKPPQTLIRRITSTEKEKSEDSKFSYNEESSKEIVLNRALSITSTPAVTVEEKEDIVPSETTTLSKKIEITAVIDTKTRLELRAKRFGLPLKMSEDERKEARKQRFGQNVSAQSSIVSAPTTGTISDNMEKLKKRAERFGESVSKILTVIENKAKLEKRKAKFGELSSPQKYKLLKM